MLRASASAARPGDRPCPQPAADAGLLAPRARGDRSRHAGIATPGASESISKGVKEKPAEEAVAHPGLRGRADDEAFTAYVSAKIPWLRRLAYQLCRDWHRADDLVQTAITKLYVNWRRAARMENLDGYVRTILVHTYLAEQRTSWWRRVVPQQHPVEHEPAADENADTEAALDTVTALAALPPRQRAAIVLRHYCDLSIEETAAILGCSTGTIKSQTARGLATLRATLTAGGAR